MTGTKPDSPIYLDLDYKHTLFSPLIDSLIPWQSAFQLIRFLESFSKGPLAARPCYIYGNSQSGSLLVSFLKKYPIRIQGIIDRTANQAHASLPYPVLPPETELQADAVVFIATAPCHYASISRAFLGPNPDITPVFLWKSENTAAAEKPGPPPCSTDLPCVVLATANYSGTGFLNPILKHFLIPQGYSDKSQAFEQGGISPGHGDYLCGHFLPDMFDASDKLKIIFLYRDPRDRIMSFYRRHFSSSHLTPLLDLLPPEALLPACISGYDIWFESGHLTAPSADQMIRDTLAWCRKPGVWAVRWEDLKAYPAGQVFRMLKFLNCNVSLEAINHAFQNDLRGIISYNGKRGQKDPLGIAKGESGNWKTHFSPDLKKVFKRVTASGLIALGYEESDAW